LKEKTMKLTKSQLKQLIKEELAGGLTEGANGSLTNAQEWHAWGETFGLAPEYDEDSQLIFYLSHDLPDRNKAAAEAVRAGASVDRDNDGNDVIYTGVYNKAPAAQPVAESMTLTKSKLKQLIKEEAATYLKEERCGRAQRCSAKAMVSNSWAWVLDGNDNDLRLTRADFDNIYKPWCHGGEEVGGSHSARMIDQYPWLGELSPEEKKAFGCAWIKAMLLTVHSALYGGGAFGSGEMKKPQLSKKEQQLYPAAVNFLGQLVQAKEAAGDMPVAESKKLTKSELKQIIKEELQNLSMVVEEDGADLSEMEPAVETAAENALNDIERAADSEEAQRVMLSALIAKLTKEIE
jgi:hypothetical protein